MYSEGGNMMVALFRVLPNSDAEAARQHNFWVAPLTHSLASLAVWHQDTS